MLMLASPRRDATRAISPGRCGSLAWTISASTYVSCSLSSTVLAVDGLSTMNRQPRRCWTRSEEHTSELQSRQYLVCRLLLEKKKQDNADHLLTTAHIVA